MSIKKSFMVCAEAEMEENSPSAAHDAPPTESPNMAQTVTEAPAWVGPLQYAIVALTETIKSNPSPRKVVPEPQQRLDLGHESDEEINVKEGGGEKGNDTDTESSDEDEDLWAEVDKNNPKVEEEKTADPINKNLAKRFFKSMGKSYPI